MKLSVEVASGVPVLRIEGDVDPDDAPALEQAAWLAFGKTGIEIVLDLEGCTHIGSTGLAVLFSLANWVRLKGGRVTIVHPTDSVLHLLRLTGLTSTHGFHISLGSEDL